MTVSGIGNDAKGDKQPVKKAGKSGALSKATSDKLKSTEKVKEGKSRVGKDQEVIWRTEDCAISEQGKMGSTAEIGNKNPVAVLQQVVSKREAEVKELEEKLSRKHDASERSVLSVQLKAAQHALKDALLNMSLTQKRDDTNPRNASNGKVDEAMEVAYDRAEQFGTVEKDAEMKEAGELVNLNIQSAEKETLEESATQGKEIEFYVDNVEDSDEEDEAINTNDKKHKNNKEQEEMVIDLTDMEAKEIAVETVGGTKVQKDTKNEGMNWADMTDNETVIQANSDQDNKNE
jgi:hypothetical protein